MAMVLPFTRLLSTLRGPSAAGLVMRRGLGTVGTRALQGPSGPVGRNPASLWPGTPPQARPVAALANGLLLPARHASTGRRRRKKTAFNTIINFVPQQEAWVIERFGKFHTVLDPGLSILIPVIDNIKYVHSLKEVAMEIPMQSAITQDNVTLQLDGVLYVRIEDAVKASYGVEDPEYAVSQLAQTTMRSEIGKLSLDTVFKERAALNFNIVESINDAAQPWGVRCLRYEIRDIKLPDKVVEVMEMQVSAERRKRASILDSEGSRLSAVNVAEGRKTAQILESEAARRDQANRAEGEADAILARARATAASIERLAEAISKPGGQNAVSLKIAQEYVEAFGHLAKESNTMLLPSSAADPASMVAQALSIYGKVHPKTLPLAPTTSPPPPPPPSA